MSDRHSQATRLPPDVENGRVRNVGDDDHYRISVGYGAGQTGGVGIRHLDRDVIAGATTVERLEAGESAHHQYPMPPRQWMTARSEVGHGSNIIDSRVGARPPTEEYRFRVRIVGASREFLVPGVEVVNMPWLLGRELADFQSADIGVVPMLDDAWSRGKCGFKELQYMAVGVPIVASGIGGGSAFLEHDANALLARDTQSFTEQIERLLLSQELRARIGRAGRHLVESQLCTELQAPVVTRLVREVGTQRQ